MASSLENGHGIRSLKKEVFGYFASRSPSYFMVRIAIRLTHWKEEKSNWKEETSIDAIGESGYR